MIWTHWRSLAGQQDISSPVSLVAGLLSGLFSHLRFTGGMVLFIINREFISNNSTVTMTTSSAVSSSRRESMVDIRVMGGCVIWVWWTSHRYLG